MKIPFLSKFGWLKHKSAVSYTEQQCKDEAERLNITFNGMQKHPPDWNEPDAPVFTDRVGTKSTFYLPKNTTIEQGLKDHRKRFNLNVISQINSNDFESTIDVQNRGRKRGPDGTYYDVTERERQMAPRKYPESDNKGIEDNRPEDSQQSRGTTDLDQQSLQEKRNYSIKKTAQLVFFPPKLASDILEYVHTALVEGCYFHLLEESNKLSMPVSKWSRPEWMGGSKTSAVKSKSDGIDRFFKKNYPGAKPVNIVGREEIFSMEKKDFPESYRRRMDQVMIDKAGNPTDSFEFIVVLGIKSGTNYGARLFRDRLFLNPIYDVSDFGYTVQTKSHYEELFSDKLNDIELGHELTHIVEINMLKSEEDYEEGTGGAVRDTYSDTFTEDAERKTYLRSIYNEFKDSIEQVGRPISNTEFHELVSSDNFNIDLWEYDYLKDYVYAVKSKYTMKTSYFLRNIKKMDHDIWKADVKGLFKLLSEDGLVVPDTQISHKIEKPDDSYLSPVYIAPKIDKYQDTQHVPYRNPWMDMDGNSYDHNSGVVDYDYLLKKKHRTPFEDQILQEADMLSPSKYGEEEEQKEDEYYVKMFDEIEERKKNKEKWDAISKTDTEDGIQVQKLLTTKKKKKVQGAHKFKVGDRLQTSGLVGNFSKKGERKGIVRYIGILNGKGVINSVWSEWAGEVVEASDVPLVSLSLGGTLKLIRADRLEYITPLVVDPLSEIEDLNVRLSQHNFKVGEKVQYNSVGHLEAIIRHIGLLGNIGFEDSIWGVWTDKLTDKWNGVLSAAGNGDGELQYCTPNLLTYIESPDPLAEIEDLNIKIGQQHTRKFEPGDVVECVQPPERSQHYHLQIGEHYVIDTIYPDLTEKRVSIKTKDGKPFGIVWSGQSHSWFYPERFKFVSHIDEDPLAEIEDLNVRLSLKEPRFKIGDKVKLNLNHIHVKTWLKESDESGNKVFDSNKTYTIDDIRIENARDNSYIGLSEISKSNGWYGEDGFIKIEEDPLSEIEDLNVRLSQDKFKINDKVRFVHPERWSLTGNRLLNEDDVYIVGDVSRHMLTVKTLSGDTVLNPDGEEDSTPFYFHIDRFEKVNDIDLLAEIEDLNIRLSNQNNFQEGDMVRVITPCPGFTTRDKVYQVTSTSGPWVRVRGDGGHIDGVRYTCVEKMEPDDPLSEIEDLNIVEANRKIRAFVTTLKEDETIPESVEVVDLKVIGSSVLVEYTGDLKETDADIINSEEILVGGKPVNVISIRREESGSIKDWVKKHTAKFEDIFYGTGMKDLKESEIWGLAIECGRLAGDNDDKIEKDLRLLGRRLNGDAYKKKYDKILKCYQDKKQKLQEAPVDMFKGVKSQAGTVLKIGEKVKIRRDIDLEKTAKDMWGGLDSEPADIIRRVKVIKLFQNAIDLVINSNDRSTLYNLVTGWSVKSDDLMDWWCFPDYAIERIQDDPLAEIEDLNVRLSNVNDPDAFGMGDRVRLNPSVSDDEIRGEGIPLEVIQKWRVAKNLVIESVYITHYYVVKDLDDLTETNGHHKGWDLTSSSLLPFDEDPLSEIEDLNMKLGQHWTQIRNEKYVYKHGEKIRCIDHDEKGRGITFDKIYEVIGEDTDGYPESIVEFVDDFGDNSGVFARRFEKINDDPLAKIEDLNVRLSQHMRDQDEIDSLANNERGLKAGDRVVFVTRNPVSFEYPEGMELNKTVYTIARLTEGGWVDLLEDEYNRWKLGQFDKIEEDPLSEIEDLNIRMSQHKFEIGDKVRIKRTVDLKQLAKDMFGYSENDDRVRVTIKPFQNANDLSIYKETSELFGEHKGWGIWSDSISDWWNFPEYAIEKIDEDPLSEIEDLNVRLSQHDELTIINTIDFENKVDKCFEDNKEGLQGCENIIDVRELLSDILNDIGVDGVSFEVISGEIKEFEDEMSVSGCASALRSVIVITINRCIKPLIDWVYFKQSLVSDILHEYHHNRQSIETSREMPEKNTAYANLLSYIVYACGLSMADISDKSLTSVGVSKDLVSIFIEYLTDNDFMSSVLHYYEIYSKLLGINLQKYFYKPSEIDAHARSSAYILFVNNKSMDDVSLKTIPDLSKHKDIVSSLLVYLGGQPKVSVSGDVTDRFKLRVNQYLNLYKQGTKLSRYVKSLRVIDLKRDEYHIGLKDIESIPSDIALLFRCGGTFTTEDCLFPFEISCFSDDIVLLDQKILQPNSGLYRCPVGTDFVLEANPGVVGNQIQGNLNYFIDRSISRNTILS